MNSTTNHYITYFKCVNELHAIETNKNILISEKEKDESLTWKKKTNFLKLFYYVIQ